MLVWPAARPSHRHHLSLCHTQAQPEDSSTLYNTHKPRLRLRRGKLGETWGRPRQAQTAQGGGQASWGEQSSLTTRRLPRQGVTTQLQCAPTDSDVRRDVPGAKQCNSFFFPLVTIKGRGWQRLQGLDLHRIEHHLKGLGLDTLSRPACNPYYKHSWLGNTAAPYWT
jgi:hypothetical protein